MLVEGNDLIILLRQEKYPVKHAAYIKLFIKYRVLI